MAKVEDDCIVLSTGTCMPMITAEERREIADYMIALWTKCEE